jgi:glucose-6-phosphate dehydrogenase assembly protein OpcA
VIVVCTGSEEAERDELEAFVSAHCRRGANTDLVCCEQVTLRARGRAGTDLVPDTVLQLLEGDCPVYTWWRRPGLSTDPLWEPLARLSDRSIVNSATASDPARVLADLADLATSERASGRPGDLAWVRLEAWREVIASEFDSATTRACLDGITAVEIETGTTPSGPATTSAGAYLVGWLASRLGWRLDETGLAWRRNDGIEVEFRLVSRGEVDPRSVGAVRIDTTIEGRKARLVAERTASGGDSVRLRVETANACALPHVVNIPYLDDAPLLCGELERVSEDAVYIESLSAAARWAARGRVT